MRKVRRREDYMQNILEDEEAERTAQSGRRIDRVTARHRSVKNKSQNEVYMRVDDPSRLCARCDTSTGGAESCSYAPGFLRWYFWFCKVAHDRTGEQSSNTFLQELRMFYRSGFDAAGKLFNCLQASHGMSSYSKLDAAARVVITLLVDVMMRMAKNDKGGMDEAISRLTRRKPKLVRLHKKGEVCSYTRTLTRRESKDGKRRMNRPAQHRVYTTHLNVHATVYLYVETKEMGKTVWPNLIGVPGASLLSSLHHSKNGSDAEPIVRVIVLKYKKNNTRLGKRWRAWSKILNLNNLTINATQYTVRLVSQSNGDPEGYIRAYQAACELWQDRPERMAAFTFGVTAPPDMMDPTDQDSARQVDVLNRLAEYTSDVKPVEVSKSNLRNFCARDATSLISNAELRDEMRRAESRWPGMVEDVTATDEADTADAFGFDYATPDESRKVANDRYNDLVQRFGSSKTLRDGLQLMYDTLLSAPSDRKHDRPPRSAPHRRPIFEDVDGADEDGPAKPSDNVRRYLEFLLRSHVAHSENVVFGRASQETKFHESLSTDCV